MTTLHKQWLAQIAYNDKIRAREQPDNYEHWMKQYILGAVSEVSEVDEILQEINWKIHRRGRVLDKHSLGRELADLTKYVWCMWEWSGFSEEDMLDFVAAKTLETEAMYAQDFVLEIPELAPVIITDIDGTLADYRKTFYRWVMENHAEDLPEDAGEHLAMEIDLGLSYLRYEVYKAEFEATGGYKDLEIYYDTENVLKDLWIKGVIILAYTARPNQRYSRIWSDTWGWLKKHNLDICIAELSIRSEQRIARACELIKEGHPVLMLEDDPTTALRAAGAGVIVALRSQPYNLGIQHHNIWRCEEYDFIALKNFLGMEA